MSKEKFQFALLTLMHIVLGSKNTESKDSGTFQPAGEVTSSSSTPAPTFVNLTNASVTVSQGQTTYLHCQVTNTGDRQVSWIKNLTILTIGDVTYTVDSRFSPIHKEGSDTWILKLTNPRPTDSGIYECQVAYHDDVEKKLTKPFKLHVADTRAEIVARSKDPESKELFAQLGSSVKVECRVKDYTEKPGYFYWYHGQDVISYSPPKGVRVETGADKLVSHLYINQASPAHSGNYTCAPATARTDSVIVRILQGENAKGLHTNKASALHQHHHILVIFIMSNIFSGLFMEFIK